MNQLEWCITSYPILCRVDRKRQPLRVFVPIFLINIRDIHFDRSRQGLYHAFRCSIRLWSIRHSGTLLLTRNSIEGSEKSDMNPGF